MTENVYKIYLIEDDKQKVQCIKEYFNSVNRLLSGEQYNSQIDFKDSHKIFKKAGFDKVEVIHITPETSDKGNYNYYFADDAAWVKQIRDVFLHDEKRIFIIDLALNKEEIAAFNRNQDTFRAVNAKKVIDILSQRDGKEDVIVESILNNIDTVYKKTLDVMRTDKFENKFGKIATLRGNLFSESTDPNYAKNYITQVFEYIFDLKGGDI